MSTPKIGKNELGVDLVEAPHKFWNQLFPNQQTFQKSVSTWVGALMSGTKPDAFDQSIELPGKSNLAGFKINVDRATTTLLLEEKPICNAPLYGDYIGPPYNPKWCKENPIGIIQNNFAEIHEYSVKEANALFAYASYLAGRQISLALSTALKSGQLILSGATIFDPFAKNDDIASDRINEFGLDMCNNRAYSNVTQAPVLSNIKVRLGLPKKDRSGGQSFEEVDAPLVQKMWKLINSGKAKGVGAAAGLVAHEAKGLGKSESKITRLCKRFRREYFTRS